MNTLIGSKIYLRALEPSDLDFLYRVENDESIWSLSSNQAPYSRYVLEQYLENALADIYETKQVRFAVCLSNNHECIGLIDLFDFDPKNKRAGIGILIYDEIYRNEGYGKEALLLIIQYSFVHLDLHQLYANISTTNLASIKLFENVGFLSVGVKSAWNFSSSGYTDESLYQLINPDH
jgi:diamine N-acetyltransferase